MSPNLLEMENEKTNSLSHKSSGVSIEKPSVAVNQTIDTEDAPIQQDGGVTAWLQVFGCWLLFMNTW